MHVCKARKVNTGNLGLAGIGTVSVATARGDDREGVADPAADEAEAASESPHAVTAAARAEEARERKPRRFMAPRT